MRTLQNRKLNLARNKKHKKMLIYMYKREKIDKQNKILFNIFLLEIIY